MKANRTVRVGMRILDGQEILSEGQEAARQLWNLACQCVSIGGDGPAFVAPSGYIRVGDDNRIVYRNGMRANKLFRSAFHKFGLWYALKDTHEYQHLSSRVAGYILSDYNAAWSAFFAALKAKNKDNKLRPPSLRGSCAH